MQPKAHRPLDSPASGSPHRCVPAPWLSLLYAPRLDRSRPRPARRRAAGPLSGAGLARSRWPPDAETPSAGCGGTAELPDAGRVGAPLAGAGARLTGLPLETPPPASSRGFAGHQGPVPPSPATRSSCLCCRRRHQEPIFAMPVQLPASRRPQTGSAPWCSPPCNGIGGSSSSPLPADRPLVGSWGPKG